MLGHAQAMARNQKNEVSFVIHNLPVIAKMGAVAKACGNMFQLSQGHAAETSGGLLICLPREQAAAYCKVILVIQWESEIRTCPDFNGPKQVGCQMFQIWIFEVSV